eukprot:scaffold111378_cov30-Prasinocladus_malaysianus.AAC.3
MVRPSSNRNKTAECDYFESAERGDHSIVRPSQRANNMFNGHGNNFSQEHASNRCRAACIPAFGPSFTAQIVTQHLFNGELLVSVTQPASGNVAI